MRRPKTLFLGLIPVLLVTVAVAFGSNHYYDPQTKTEFAPGNWSFSAHPFMGEGYKTRPVVVTSVGSEVTTLSIDSIRVNNISSKPVLGVKFGWFLTTDEKRGNILRQGETPFVPISPVLHVASNRVLKPTIVSFLEIHKALVKKGRLDGTYRLEVAVTEVLFSDRSAWRVGQDVSILQGTRNLFAKVALSESPPVTVTPLVIPDSCPKQLCVHVPVTPPHYTCGPSQNDEFCTNCVVSCCNRYVVSSPLATVTEVECQV